jgi:hypothetical protein
VTANGAANLVVDAERIRRLERWVIEHVGRMGATLLRQILAEGYIYREIAHARGITSQRKSRLVGWQFRACLEDLAKAWSTDRPI